jgi:DNA-binding XRE family transcriptional regulator
MLPLDGMMNAQRNRGMYLRVGERLAEIRKSRKISQAKLAKLFGVVEGTIQNYEHGRNEPNITRLYDTKRGRQPRDNAGQWVARPVCPAAQAANFGLLDLQLTEADRRPFKLLLQLGEL